MLLEHLRDSLDQIDDIEHWLHTTPARELVSVLEVKCHTQEGYPAIKHLTHGYTVNHSTMVGINIAFSCAGSTCFINKSLVLMPKTIIYSTWPLHIVKVGDISLLLVYRLIADMQHL